MGWKHTQSVQDTETMETLLTRDATWDDHRKEWLKEACLFHLYHSRPDHYTKCGISDGILHPPKVANSFD